MSNGHNAEYHLRTERSREKKKEIEEDLHLWSFHYSLAYLFLVQFQTAVFPLNKEEEQEMGEGIIFYLFRLFKKKGKKKKKIDRR